MISADAALELASRSQRIITVMIVLLCAVGCHSGALRNGRPSVSDHVAGRFGVAIGEQESSGEPLLPPGVDLEDGVSEDEAVQTALWNNAAYQELLAQLGFTDAQLLNAGLISDPQFMLYLPIGPKVIETFGYQAVDALWLQPIRVRAAELDLDQVTESMVQNGLNVIRDARQAHAELVRATQAEKVSREAAELQRAIADLAAKRLAAGDISELEVTTSEVAALQAEAAAKRAVHDAEIARGQLRTLLGLTLTSDAVETAGEAVEIASLSLSESSESGLLNLALAGRPDLRAAEIGIESAQERLNLARHQFMNLDAVYNGKPVGNHGFLSAPGLRFTLPVFNGNRGGIAIADAQLQQANRQFVTVRDRITLEVRTARTQYLQARENLQALRTEILPVLHEAETLARRNYENGGAPYFLVLQTTSQYLDARMRELQLEADLRRAIAELDRSVGHRVSQSVKSTELPQVPAVEPATADNPSEKSGGATAVWQLKRTPLKQDAPQPLPLPAGDDRTIARIPLDITVDKSGRVSAVTPSSHTMADETEADGSRASRKKWRRRQKQDDNRDQRERKLNADTSRSEKSKQDAEHVQVTIDIRLDPRLVPAGVPTAEGGLRDEDSTSED